MSGPYWDVAWNPVTGCTPCSPGCEHCWAERIAARHLPVTRCPLCDGSGRIWESSWTEECPTCHGSGNAGFYPTFHPNRVDRPLHWRKPRIVFVGSMGDLFIDWLARSQRHRVFEVMADTPQHTYLVLTKRPHVMREYILDLMWVDVLAGRWPLPNVWLGVSVCDREEAERKVPCLVETPAAHRWLSFEPLLSGVPDLDLSGIEWVVLGGESGPGARPMNPVWALDVWQQGWEALVPFFFTQWGSATDKQVLDQLRTLASEMAGTRELPWEAK